MNDRAHYSITDRQLERTSTGDCEAAILIADTEVVLVASPVEAFDMLVAGADVLRVKLPRGSQRSAAAAQFSAYGRHAINGDRTVKGPHRSIMNASAMLDVVRETLGEDAAEKVRLAAVRRMGLG